jgi:hypothetical protein
MAHSNILSAQSPSNLSRYDEGIISELRTRGTPLSLMIGEEFSIVRAHVTSGVAASMLAPLGRGAVNKFKTLDGNMVLVDAFVTHAMARRMLAASRQVA